MHVVDPTGHGEGCHIHTRTHFALYRLRTGGVNGGLGIRTIQHLVSGLGPVSRLLDLHLLSFSILRILVLSTSNEVGSTVDFTRGLEHKS